MVFYGADFDFSGVDTITDEIDELPSVFADAMLNTSIVIERQYLPRLQEYPPPRDDRPFRFATPKSRRYYFYLIKSGQVKTDGKHYIRTGGYAKSWVVDVAQNGEVFQIYVGARQQAPKGGVTIGNRSFTGGQFLPFKVMEYIGGDLQVPGHKDTGWTLYHPILDEISAYMDRAFFEAVESYV
jgi:hypothetical protein